MGLLKLIKRVFRREVEYSEVDMTKYSFNKRTEDDLLDKINKEKRC